MVIFILYGQFHLTFHCMIHYFIAKFTNSLQSSQIRCEVHKFISEFTGQFLNKGYDWPLNSKTFSQSNAQFTTCNKFADFTTKFGNLIMKINIHCNPKCI